MPWVGLGGEAAEPGIGGSHTQRGKSGPAIVRGKADGSLMFKMAAHRIPPVMPPKDKPANKPMTSLELGLLQMWINQGPRMTLTRRI